MGNETSGNLPEQNNNRHALCTPLFMEKLDSLFMQLDTNGDNELEKNEVIDAFKKAKKNTSEA